MFCRTNKSSSWQQEGQDFLCPGRGDRKSTTCVATAAGPSGPQGHPDAGPSGAGAGADLCEGLVATS